MTDTAIRELAARLAALENFVGKRGSQLAYSALEDGAIREFDLEGSQTAQYGKQYDGTSVAASLKGPPPPQPTAPTVQAVAGGFLVGWDGLYADGPTVVSPMDWLRTDVVYGAPGFNPIATPPTMAIVSPRGGLAFVAADPGNYEVALVARSQSGTASLPSTSVAVTALPAADAGAVTQAQMDADQAIADALAAAILGQQGIDDAADARSWAVDAGDTATLARADVINLTSVVNGKTTAFRQASAPSTSGRTTGDLWIDSDDGLLYVWTGAWTLSPDQRIAAVVASNATKSTVFAQTSAPSTSGRTIGDLWIDTDDGNRQYVWEGSWVDRRDATIAAAASLAATAQSTAASKITVYRQSSAPTGTFVVNDLWLDTDDGLVYYASTTAGGWTLHADQRVGLVVTSNATKITVFAQTSSPSTSGRTNGDIWFDIDDGNKHYVWNGAWTAILLGAAAISATAVDLGGAPRVTTGSTSKTFYNILTAVALTGNLTGTEMIVIDTPITFTNKMFSIHVKGLNYITGRSDIDFTVSSYATTVPAFGTSAFNNTGSSPITARLARNIATNTVAIIMTSNEAGSIKWSNTKLSIPEALIGHTSGVLDSWVSGWSTSVVVDEAAITAAYDTIATPAAYDAGALATLAKSTADGKVTVYRQATAPTGSGAFKVNDIWIDTDDGLLYLATSTSGAWVASPDQRIAQALVLVDDATAMNPNPNFADWVLGNAVPNRWTAYQGGPTSRETTIVRSSPAARFDCTDTTTNRGLYQSAAIGLPIGLEYVTASVDVYLVAGTFSGAGVFIDWSGMTGGVRTTIDLATELPAPVLGKWYRITKVLRRPLTATGTQTGYAGYVMANFPAASFGAMTVKDMVVNRLGFRPSTQAEIDAYLAAPQATVSALTTVVNSKTTVFAQISAPPTTGRTIGDVWIDTDDGNKVYDWSGSWTVRMFGAPAISATARELGAVTIYRQSAAPASGMVTNDLWVDSDDGLLYIYAGGWQLSSDQRVATLVTSNATKVTLFSQTSQPATTGRTIGDIWIDTDDGNRAYVWEGASWVDRRDTTIAAASALATLAKSTADAKITVYRQSAAPVGTFVVNDLWIDTDDGMLYAATTTAGAWTPSPDQRIATVVTSNATKTTVFAQISQPPTTGRTVGDIWIDTDDGNKIYDWSGSWTVRLLGAPAISATARQLGAITIYRQSTAPASGYVVNDLWVDSDDGLLYIATSTSVWTPSPDQRIATVVSSNATKVTAFAQTSAPSTSGRVLGDIWVDTDDSNKIYIWDGAWTVRLVGAGAISATARQLGAVNIYRQATAPASGMADNDLWIDSDDGLVYVYGTSTWNLSADQRVGTLVTSNATKVSAFWQTSAPSTTDRALGDLWFDTDDGNKVYNWTGAWIPQVYGDSAIGGVGTGKLLTGSISAGVEVIAGNPLTNHAKMTSSGFKVFVEDPVDFVSNEVVRMGSDTGDLFAITDATGQVKASISETGSGAFTGLSVDATSFDADDKPAGGLTIYGTEFLDYINALPRGMVAWENFGTDKGPTGASEVGYGEIGFRMDPTRLYKVSVRGAYDHSTAGAGASFRLRMTSADAPTAAPSPTITSNTVLQVLPWRHSVAGADSTFSDFATLYNETGAPKNVRLLLTYAGAGTAAGATVRAFGGGSSTFASPEGGVIVCVEDIGQVSGQGGAYNTGGVVVTPVQTYVSTWNATNSMGYTGSNVADNDADVKQGYSSADGDSHGVIIFGGGAASGEKTKTIATALTGATLKKVEVYLYFNHWYYNSGGTAIIRAYNSTSLSSSTPTGTTKQSASWPKPGGRWVDITSIATTAIRGVTVGKAGSTNLLYYGRVNGYTMSNKPQLRLTYTR